ncbi:hypothetical protein ZIOFF_070472 [Zingiber officinale]|uniref:CST complex subunit STN1 n=1 Tax=Zingiber officinale TaxID=94328 RepID=A0A8J5C2H2_ZINOF|nr:hypothetical protein ZIOFF_070472 [Zingiber officinale]
MRTGGVTSCSLPSLCHRVTFWRFASHVVSPCVLLPAVSPRLQQAVVSSCYPVVSSGCVPSCLVACSVPLCRVAPRALSRHVTCSVSSLETVGVVVSKEHTGDYLRFVVDDGTGCIHCILDITDRSDLGLAAKVETEIALREAATDELGKLVRVRGMITLGVGVGLQLTVRDVLVERDPNMETLYWMDCIRLAESCYDHAACP